MKSLPAFLSDEQLATPLQLEVVELSNGWIVEAKDPDAGNYVVLPLGKTSPPYSTNRAATNAAQVLVELNSNYVLM